ncbi:hypothetical protein SAMN05428988_3160 [Chitinophaga sp. YR573]|uniref:hypothetical protein n=1 Tax=Chitinophaga sp. YR573 TaxID=1881040 RepID=UPI0008D62434|nr:hypothetical protein [Chitinophaga sp. YR573]SEW21003.1 hypothetical protein SAMN05428988_3160 [Chitinophaga sp. YR573]
MILSDKFAHITDAIRGTGKNPTIGNRIGEAAVKYVNNYCNNSLTKNNGKNQSPDETAYRIYSDWLNQIVKYTAQYPDAVFLPFDMFLAITRQIRIRMGRLVRLEYLCIINSGPSEKKESPLSGEQPVIDWNKDHVYICSDEVTELQSIEAYKEYKSAAIIKTVPGGYLMITSW